MTVAEARKIMGDSSKKYSNAQIEEVINIFVVLSDLAIDSYLQNRSEKNKYA